MIAKLKPNRVRRTYLGGGRIDAFTGCAPADDGALRPEDWLASTTTAFNGSVEIEGEGLGRLEDGRLVKDAVGTLPILVKLLDSDERLVIQAHPTVPFAQKFMNSPVGKTECWYFLPGTAPDACVYLGFKPGVTRETWKTAVDAAIGGRGRSPSAPNGPGADPDDLAKDPAALIANGAKLLDLMHRVPVRPGDSVFVDGGMPHAIGGGCFMIELQEPSDLMVVAERFTPSGRELPEKKLHGGLGFEKMLDVYEYGGLTFDELCQKYVRHPIQQANNPDNRTARRILGPELTDKFEMWEIGAFRGNAPTGDVALAGADAVVIVTAGEGALNGLAVRKGDRLVVSGEDCLSPGGNVTAVACFKRSLSQTMLCNGGYPTTSCNCGK